jgi:hypothetical protein
LGAPLLYDMLRAASAAASKPPLTETIFPRTMTYARTYHALPRPPARYVFLNLVAEGSFSVVCGVGDSGGGHELEEDRAAADILKHVLGCVLQRRPLGCSPAAVLQTMMTLRGGLPHD